MPRKVTDEQRAANVEAAAAALPEALNQARMARAAWGIGAPETLRAWADVEALGATIHRQARLLAGKPRGG